MQYYNTPPTERCNLRSDHIKWYAWIRKSSTTRSVARLLGNFLLQNVVAR